MPENTKSLFMEVDRIEEDAELSYKGHYNVADWWEKINLIIGIPTATLSAVVGIVAYNDHPCVALALSILTAGLVALMTILNPAERAQQHKSAAGCYHTLRNQARIFKHIEIPSSADFSSLKKIVLEMAAQRDQLNRLSLIIPRWAYEKAIRDVDEGRTVYRTDKGDGNESK